MDVNNVSRLFDGKGTTFYHLGVGEEAVGQQRPVLLGQLAQLLGLGDDEADDGALEQRELLNL